MCAHKEIELSSFSQLGDDIGQVKKVLYAYAEAEAMITIDGKVADAQLLSLFWDYLIGMNQKNMRECQQRGIEKALQRKSEGLGHYGRPIVVLPKDFDEQIRKRLQQKQQLSAYCEELKMKKSTFYKYAKLSMRKSK